MVSSAYSLRRPNKILLILTKWIGNMFAILLGSSITGNVVYNLFPKILSSDLHPLQNPLYFQSRRMLFWVFQ